MTQSPILIVEDDALMADILDNMVQLVGYETILVRSAQDALTAVAGQMPELALLDLNLPDFDGIELCRRLKADPALRQIPVIFVSIENDPTLIKHATQIGAARYLVKPVGLDDLERAITDVIREQVD